jgi:hypothetical protein
MQAAVSANSTSAIRSLNMTGFPTLWNYALAPGYWKYHHIFEHQGNDLDQ